MELLQLYDPLGSGLEISVRFERAVSALEDDALAPGDLTAGRVLGFDPNAETRRVQPDLHLGVLPNRRIVATGSTIRDPVPPQLLLHFS